MVPVKECITVYNDELKFTDSCGISVEALGYYLNLTIVGWRNKVYAQRSGICKGSKVAPVVSDILLAHVDCALERELKGLALRTFRYVDDYLFFFVCEDYNPTRKMVDI